jgi:thymidylate synthase
MEIMATSLDDAWYQVIRECYLEGVEYTIQRGSFEQCKRKQLEYVAVEIKCPWVRPLIPIMPEGLPAPCDIDYVNNYLAYLMEDDVKSNEQYTYGTSIKKQIPYVIDMLKNTPNTNQACITVGSPDSIKLKDPECLRLIALKLINNKLNMTVFYRSWDAYAGWPTNLAGLQLFKEYLCQEIGCKDGKIFAFSDGLHLYDYQYDLVRNRIGGQ